MKRAAWLAAAMAATLAAAGSDVVAQRGSATLTTDDVRAILARLETATRDKLTHDPAALSDYVRARLLQSALLAEAKAKQWDQRPDIAERASQAHDAVIVDSYVESLSQPPENFPSDADIQAAYEANKTRFVIPRQYHVSQIFLAVAAGTSKPAEDDVLKRARDLRAQAARPKADFADLARHNSQDHASAEKGGDLGWVREDQLAPAIKDALAGVPEGSMTDPVRLPDGFHVLRLAETKPAAAAPLADVRDQIVRALRAEKTNQNARAYVAELQRKDPVQLNEIGLSSLARP